jgi:UDP:flavonoid glycosyltransferase YjiC (YdhE family)
MAGKAKVLFMAEAVTLAHASRPAVLARALDPDRYRITFAADPRFSRWLGRLPFEEIRLHSIPSEDFMRALAAGRPYFDERTLRGYVAADLEVIDRVKPDLIVGDWRLSLSISARRAGVPYWAISNSYWSPYAAPELPVPDVAGLGWLPVPVLQFFFHTFRGLFCAPYTRPMNRLAREIGHPGFGSSLRRLYTDADRVLYADVPELTPTQGLPSHHAFLGPIVWSPTVDPPGWWAEIDDRLPIVYVTLGSSGPPALLGTVLEALRDLPVRVIASLAGAQGTSVPRNARVAPFLNGELAAQRAALVICNGGSPTVQQALAAGRPVLGLPTNLDQYLSMATVVRAGAGLQVRGGRASPAAIRQAAERLLGTPEFARSADRLRRAFARFPATDRFADQVAAALGIPADRAAAG